MLSPIQEVIVSKKGEEEGENEHKEGKGSIDGTADEGRDDDGSDDNEDSSDDDAYSDMGSSISTTLSSQRSQTSLSSLKREEKKGNGCRWTSPPSCWGQRRTGALIFCSWIC